MVHFVNRITPPVYAPNHNFPQSERRVLCMTNVAARYGRDDGSGLRFTTVAIIR
jgi:hypothetical protein